MAHAPVVPISSDRWLVPGNPTFTLFFPDIDEMFQAGQISESDALRASRRKLRNIVRHALLRIGVRSDLYIDDLVQSLEMRIATMNAYSRYERSRGSPSTFIRSIARMLICEHFFRRPQVATVSLDSISEPSFDGNQLVQAERSELLDELKPWLEQLSAGELRALLNEFGPVFDYSCPVSSRKRCVNSEALDRAVEILQRSAARRISAIDQ